MAIYYIVVIIFLKIDTSPTAQYDSVAGAGDGYASPVACSQYDNIVKIDTSLRLSITMW